MPGAARSANFEETPLEAHDQVIQTDLIGYLRGAYVALPFFKAQGSGTLINTLSLGSWVAQPYAAEYSASKFGFRGLTDALRGQVAKAGRVQAAILPTTVSVLPRRAVKAGKTATAAVAVAKTANWR